jgi:hypothetical protein
MFARIMVAMVVVGLGCQPESFHAGLGSGPGPGASGAAGVGTMTITVPGGMGGSDLAGTGGGGILPGQAGVGGTAGLSGQAGVVGGTAGVVGGTAGVMGGTAGVVGGTAGVTGGTAGVTGGGAGAGGSAVDAGAGRNGGAGGGVQDAGVEAPPTVAYVPAQWKPTASITAAGNADVPANVLDGNPATRWTTGRNQVGDESFVIDLGKTESVSRVVLDDSGFPQDFPVSYTVEVSTNGNTFTMVDMGMGATITRMDFTRTMARTLRIKQTGKTAANGSWWSIGELSIYP